MKTKPRALFVILFVVPALLLVPVWLVGSSIYHGGTIEFSVHEKHDGGCRVSGKVPAILVPAAMRLAPASVMDEMRRDVRCEVGDALEIVRAVARELSRCDDGVLVDVRTTSEVVTVTKRNGRIEVDVDTPRETVHAAMPLRTLGSVLAAI